MKWHWETEIDRLRAELAQVREILSDREARIAELEAAGNRLGDAAVDGVLTSIEAVTELAEAKARIAEVLATDAKRVDEYNTLLGVIAAANARIAELETERAKLSSFHDMLTKLSHALARAEKAERDLKDWQDSSEAYRHDAEKAEADCKRAEAERDAMREALQNIVHGYFQGIASRLDGGYSLACLARAALNSSPAGEKS